MRKTVRNTLVTAIVVAAAIRLAPAQEAGGWVSLFDGKTTEGWTQLNGKATYEVKDGAIVGHTAEGSPNSFLCTSKTFGDFELEFDVKCDKGLNSGCQIRSKQKTAQDTAGQTAQAKKNNAAGRVFGPQIEIECGPGQAGFVYGEATSFGWLSPEPKSKDKTVSQHDYFKNDDWNHFRVIAQGPRIQTFINDRKVTDLTHEEIYKTHPKGFIGLQVHAVGKGKSYQVAWRNIRIRELK